MKILKQKDLKWIHLQSKSGEKYAQTSVISKPLQSEQMFVHLDQIPPGQRSSGKHRHTLCEELVVILEGEVVIEFGSQNHTLQKGDAILFQPQDSELHCLWNKQTTPSLTLTCMSPSVYDLVKTESSSPEDVSFFKTPEFKINEQLHEQPLDTATWSEFLEKLKTQLSHVSSGFEQLKILELLGSTSRVLGFLKDAEVYLHKALMLSLDYPGQEKYLQNLIRLAHVYQWKKEFDKAHVLFHQGQMILDNYEISEITRSTYDQHFGKFFFDQEKYDLALECFQKALNSRQSLGRHDLIESTELAIVVTQQKLQSASVH